jgi:RNase P protein component
VYKDIKQPYKIIILIRKDFTNLKPNELKAEITKLIGGIVK